MGCARGSEEARGVLYKAHGRILPQKSHTAAGLCGEKMTEQEKSTTIFVPLSYHGGGAAVKRFCGFSQGVFRHSLSGVVAAWIPIGNIAMGCQDADVFKVFGIQRRRKQFLPCY